MTIILRTQNQRPAMGFAAVTLTALSLFGSDPRAGVGQESAAPQVPVPAAKPNPVPTLDPGKLADESPATPAAAGNPVEKALESAPRSANPVLNPNYSDNVSVDPVPKKLDRKKLEADAERVSRLEKQLFQLTNELRALRSEKNQESSRPPKSFNVPVRVPSPRSSTSKTESRPAAKPQAAAGLQRSTGVVQSSPQSIYVGDATGSYSESYQTGTAQNRAMLGEDSNVQSVSIIRATYKLPPGRAAAIARFLTEQLNDEVEIKVKGDTLQITASVEDQRTISPVIQLFLVKGRAPALPPTPDPLQGDANDIRGKESS